MSEIVDIHTCLYDKREVYRNCTVEVLTNTVTGDVSVGWWQNDDPPIGCEEDDE